MSRGSDYANAIGNLYQLQAQNVAQANQARANAGIQRAQIIGGTLSNLGQMVAGLPQAMRERKIAGLKEQAFLQDVNDRNAQRQVLGEIQTIIQNANGKLDENVAQQVMAKDREAGLAILKIVQDAKDHARQVEKDIFDQRITRDAAEQDILSKINPKDPQSIVIGRTRLEALPPAPDGAPSFDPSSLMRTPAEPIVETARRSGMTAAQLNAMDNPPPPDLVPVPTTRNGVEGTTFAPKSPDTFVPKGTTPPSVGSFEQYVLSRFGPTPTPPQIEQARQQWVVSGQAPRVAGTAPASVGSFEDFVQRKFGPRPTSDQISQARKEWAASGQAPRSTEETAQDRQRVARLDSARGFLDRLNELRAKINTKMGPSAGLTGIARRGAAAIGMDPDVAEYERERAAGGRALAVAIMGAQNLSDADAAAWANMLPDARTDEQTAQRLTAQVERMLESMNPSLQGTTVGPLVTPATQVPAISSPTFRTGPYTVTVEP